MCACPSSVTSRASGRAAATTSGSALISAGLSLPTTSSTGTVDGRGLRGVERLCAEGTHLPWHGVRRGQPKGPGRSGFDLAQLFLGHQHDLAEEGRHHFFATPPGKQVVKARQCLRRVRPVLDVRRRPAFVEHEPSDVGRALDRPESDIAAVRVTKQVYRRAVCRRSRIDDGRNVRVLRVERVRLEHPRCGHGRDDPSHAASGAARAAAGRSATHCGPTSSRARRRAVAPCRRRRRRSRCRRSTSPEERSHRQR